MMKLVLKITLLLVSINVFREVGGYPKPYRDTDPYYDPESDQEYAESSSELQRRGRGILPNSAPPHPPHSLSPSSIFNHTQTQTYKTSITTPPAPNSQPNSYGLSPNLASISSNLSSKSSRLLTRHPRHAKSLLKSLMAPFHKKKTPISSHFSRPQSKRRPLTYTHFHLNNPLSPPLPGAEVLQLPAEEATSGFSFQEQIFPNGDRYQGVYDSQGDIRPSSSSGGSGWIPLEQMEGGGWNPLVRVKPIPQPEVSSRPIIGQGQIQGQGKGTRIPKVQVKTAPPLWTEHNKKQAQKEKLRSGSRPLQSSYISATREDTWTPLLEQNALPPVADTVNLYHEVVDYDEGQLPEQVVIDYVTYYDEIVEDQDKPSGDHFEDEVYASSRLAPSRTRMVEMSPKQSPALEDNKSRKSSRFTFADANAEMWGKVSTTTTPSTTPPQPKFIQQLFRSTTRRPIRRQPLVYRTTTPKSNRVTSSKASGSSSQTPQLAKEEPESEGSTKFYYAIKKNPEDWETWAEDLFSNPSQKS